MNGFADGFGTGPSSGPAHGRGQGHGHGYWVPPTEVERQLYEAGLRGDTEAQLRVLAAEDLYIGQYRHEVEAEPDTVSWYSVTDTASGRLCRPVLTRGMLPPWQPGWVFHEVTLDWVAQFPWTDPAQWLAVNGGTPAAVHLAASPQHRAVWRRRYAENELSTRHRLLALRTGPLLGPLAYGLACGAHLAVRDGVPWNEVGTVYHGYRDERRLMLRDWGLGDHDSWQKQLAALLDFANSPAQYEYALWVREELRRARGELPHPDLWRETAAGTLQDRGAPSPVVMEMEEVVRRVMRYEARFRADGLLPEDGWVKSAAGYDYGRAVCLARWGLSARFCSPHEAEQAIVHAGALCRSAYLSWEEFSAGYVLGRVLRFDDEEYGPYYQDMLTAHRLLTENEGSPWRNIPWR
ncbi:DUF1266 domain-containing protein [Streptomyces sp. GC420]|uniref:DUF1266 domain-containing protein n=1 Tax=Streptomyces sp. GC420 TaxID=2697568 RepID=UPI0014151C04|nr:DUF1266 domain-containing protein [Streptomyces sp. GC420]NBM18004.1 DUF1266 domain-containing protein [Streptomyces sp. GC420]